MARVKAACLHHFFLRNDAQSYIKTNILRALICVFAIFGKEQKKATDRHRVAYCILLYMQCGQYD